jgi:hypothetical protein
MNRRRFILVSGTSATVALAGCSGDSDSGDGGTGDEDGLIFGEHELVEGDLGTSIKGRLTNETGSEQSYVEVRARLYDANDARLGDTILSNTTNLADGATWRFEINIIQNSEEIDRYELEAGTETIY